jgi:hypothetical protein
MDPKSPNPSDRREHLLDPQEIDRWYDTPDGKYRIGLKDAGEFAMDARSGYVDIATADGTDWMNFGRYRFFLPNWGAGLLKPEQWENPFRFTESGQHLALNWLCFHVHGTIISVIVHFKRRSFCLLEPARILTVKNVNLVDGHWVAVCDETKWVDSHKQELFDVHVPLPFEWGPIENFYTLDPMSIQTNVYIWHEGKLTITPLGEYRTQGISEQ